MIIKSDDIRQAIIELQVRRVVSSNAPELRGLLSASKYIVKILLQAAVFFRKSWNLRDRN